MSDKNRLAGIVSCRKILRSNLIRAENFPDFSENETFFSENETEQEDFLAFETVGLVQDFLWGLLEPSGEECVAVDSALKVRIMDKLI